MVASWVVLLAEKLVSALVARKADQWEDRLAAWWDAVSAGRLGVATAETRVAWMAGSSVVLLVDH